jgi:Kef-type K+ transport system membrane component KefB/predicted transcriptional regulator
MAIVPPNLLLGTVPGTGLLFGLLLVAALIAGYLAHMFRVPRVVGYLAAGAIMRLVLDAALHIEPGTERAAELAAAERPFAVVKDLALGLILFSIGAVFETRHLRAVGRNILTLLLGESGLGFLVVFVGTAAVGLLVDDRGQVWAALASAVLLGIAAIATAPAATLLTLREFEAKGPTTDTILSVTGANNVLCIVAFHVCFMLLAASGILGEVALSKSDIWLGIAWSTLGSVSLGLALGFLISVAHAKLRVAETIAILVAAFIVLSAGEKWLLQHVGASYNFLLTTLCVGAVFANVAIDPERLESALRTLGHPVFIGFFVLAGYGLHLGELVDLRLIGMTYVACRLAGKILGAWWGARRARRPGEITPYIGAALLCQAAVVVGLADFVSNHWLQADAARSFATTIVGSVVFFELCGPLLVKWVVVRSGEVKAVTLLHHSVPAAAEGDSVVALTWQALLRTVGLRHRRKSLPAEALQARHIMRTNIKCIRADERFDQVLHAVEQSRYNHFPVVDEHDELVGVIHFSDIRGIIYDPVLSDLVTALDLANPDTPAVPVDMSLRDLLAVFKAGDVGSLPVVESVGSRRVVGIVEQRDLLRTLHLSRNTV